MRQVEGGAGHAPGAVDVRSPLHEGESLLGFRRPSSAVTCFVLRTSSKLGGSYEAMSLFATGCVALYFRGGDLLLVFVLVFVDVGVVVVAVAVFVAFFVVAVFCCCCRCCCRCRRANLRCRCGFLRDGGGHTRQRWGCPLACVANPSTHLTSHPYTSTSVY